MDRKKAKSKNAHVDNARSEPGAIFLKHDRAHRTLSIAIKEPLQLAPAVRVGKLLTNYDIIQASMSWRARTYNSSGFGEPVHDQWNDPLVLYSSGNGCPGQAQKKRLD